MTDQQFPGFEEDDPKPKKKSQAPPPPPVTAAAPPPAAPSAANYEFEESAPAPKRKAPAMPPPPVEPQEDQTLPTVSPVRAPAPSMPVSAPLSEGEDPDIKPGSRKDLWLCPHCGTGNKPDRTTCRKCGKSPDDEVEQQWYQKPPIIGGIVGGAVVIILLFLFIGGTDLSLRPADVDHIDSKIRTGGSATGSHDLETRTFTAKKRFAVCGRCIGTTQNPTVQGAWTVVLLLGGKAKSEDAASAYTVTFNGERADVTPDSGTYKTIHLLPGGLGKIEPKKGAIISLAGDVGEVDGIGGYGEPVVWLDGFNQE